MKVELKNLTLDQPDVFNKDWSTWGLASTIQKMGPPTAFSTEEKRAQDPWAPDKVEDSYVLWVKVFLEQGADPNGIRIAGFVPRTGWNRESAEQSKIAIGGVTGTMSFWSSGSMGKLVWPGEGGESLIDFCHKYGLLRTAAMLQAHGAKQVE